MIVKVLGYVKREDKNGRPYAIIHYYHKMSNAQIEAGGSGFVCENGFLPPYLVDKAPEFIDHICDIKFKEYNGKYSISNVTITDSVL